MKRMLSILSQKWPEYLLEILVITIGILGAFALNKWNESENNHDAKLAFIENVTEEFESNLAQLDTVISYDTKVIDASIYLMHLISQGAVLEEDKMDSLFNDLSNLWSFDPSRGALRSAVSSGNIHLLENQKLLNYLFSWEDVVLDAREDEDRFINHHMGKALEFYDNLQVADAYHKYDATIPKSSFKSNYKALLEDRKFENFLADKALFTLDARRELLMVRQISLEILELLKEEK